MDNDNLIVKCVKHLLKDLKFHWDYRDKDILNDDDGNHAIMRMLEDNKPFLIARGGATEMRCIAEYLSTGTFSKKITEEIKTLSGVFSNDAESLLEFCNLYISSMSVADIIALWGVGAESKVVHWYCNEAMLTKIRALEPYYFDDPWSKHLEGKKLLVVHPFADTIQSQFKKRSLIFPNNLLPENMELSTIKAVQTIAGCSSDFNTWFDALDYMKHQIDNADFDIAIIGAGAYGLPLAAHCKAIGKQAIQLSGATQILFGIKGKRWDNHSFISKLYNEHWVRAKSSETPQHKEQVEGGSYW